MKFWKHLRQKSAKSADKAKALDAAGPAGLSTLGARSTSLDDLSRQGGSGKSQLCPSLGSLRAHSPNGARAQVMRGQDASRMRQLGPLESDHRDPLSVCSRVIQVTLARHEGSLGFTLRGGSNPDPQVSRPLTVTQVRPGGPADREGTIRVGDRLVAVDNTLVASATLLDAQRLLQQSQHLSHCTLTIEYDVGLSEAARHATGPLLVEIALPGAQAQGLGVTLADREGTASWISRDGRGGEVSNCVVVATIAPGGTADRCGGLRVGDQVLAVDGTRVEGTTLTAAQVAHALDSVRDRVTLEILPATHVRVSGSSRQTPSPTSLSSLSELRRRGSLRRRADSESRSSRTDRDDLGSCASVPTLRHPETLHLSLTADPRGYGLTVADDDNGAVVIATVEPGSPADRSGCVLPGDRVLSANHSTTPLSATDVTTALRDLDGVVLATAFDVADAVVPDSGVFDVRLAKRGAGGLGITVTAGGDGGAVISAVRRGSVAHRSGALTQGDRLLAVDAEPVARATLRQTRQVLQRCADVVTLRVRKDRRSQADACEPACAAVAEADGIVYTVELARHGGSLGVTLGGSLDGEAPVVVAGLTRGGLAEQTGALHVGDRLLAINGQSLQGRPLSDAVAMLDDVADSVTLKISRGRSQSSLPPFVPSVDSAVESWDSRNGWDGVGAFDDDFGGNSHEMYATESATVRRRLRGVDSAALWRSLDAVDDAPSWEAAHSELRSNDSDVSLPDADPRDSYADRVTPPLDYYDPAPSPLPLPLPPYSRDSRQSTEYEDSVRSQTQLYQVTLFKDAVYEDFGFSVSDGLYERGVYVNRVRKGGPADVSVTLKPFDRILQVNETRTHDFDCCLTVPLIASAGERLELTIARNDCPVFNDIKDFNSQDLPWVQEENGNVMNRSITSVTKTL